MLKEKSSPWAMLRYLYVLPVAAIAVTAFARPEVSETTEEISAFKVNDLAALVEAKVAKSITVVQADAALSDTTRVSGAKNVSNLEIGAREGTAWNIEAGTISGAETPLFIVDGKEVASSLIAALKPESIKSITVLKDGSATETYGEKGKNGVILITLKTGQDPVVVGYRVRTDSGAKDSSQLTKILFKTANEATTESDLTVFIDGVETDMTGKKLDDVIPADQIEAIHVKKGGGKKGIYVVSKKTVTKVSAKDDIK